jgi:hypothetical protein
MTQLTSENIISYADANKRRDSSMRDVILLWKERWQPTQGLLANATHSRCCRTRGMPR